MDSKAEKQSPFGQYEWVDVTFPDADIDVVVPYSRLRPESPYDVRWLDITQQGRTVTQAYVDTAGSSIDTSGQSTGVTTTTLEVPRVYRTVDVDARPFGFGYIVLRCTVGAYSTRLLLFVERNEG